MLELALLIAVAAAQPLPAPPADGSPSAEEHASAEEGPLSSPELTLRGFGDVQFFTNDDRATPASFALGQLDLFPTSRLSDDLSMLAEIVFEAGEDNTFAVDVERLLLTYAPRDYLKISVGRHHTAIGYFNTSYHHGEWFLTTIGRPLIFRFEDDGGILPIHNVGLSVTGQIPSGRLGLRYVAEVGNGRRSRSREDEPVQNVSDENGRKAVNLALLARPATGLQTGVSLYLDRLTPQSSPRVSESILAVHLVYQRRVAEVLGEAIFIRHRPRGGPQFRTSAFYLQGSRRFGKWQPYFRYQYLDVPAEDPVFAPAGRSQGPAVGLRYDLGVFTALKAQYERLSGRAPGAVNELRLQAAFTF